ncbi:hypothetical protein CJJ07_004688 [Candidozyma auris]|nr:hypothetical protein CJJ07_004688 [[Candida] auris]QEL60689.1 hypothetical protein CJJ09_002805 [[Candida] auris]
MFNFSNLARFTGFARAASRSVVASKPTVTMFHNPNVPMSHQILQKLKERAPKTFNLDVRENQLPHYSTYHFIHEKCINVHPQNARGFERIFPALLDSSNHTFCDVEVRKNSKQKQFVPDIDLVSENTYLDKVAHQSASNMAPFAVDWFNQLVATDEEGLNRLLANYNSTHIVRDMKEPKGKTEVAKEDAVKVCAREPPSNLQPSVQHGCAPSVASEPFTSRASAAAMACVVHPHIAEFADLF